MTQRKSLGSAGSSTKNDVWRANLSGVRRRRAAHRRRRRARGAGVRRRRRLGRVVEPARGGGDRDLQGGRGFTGGDGRRAEVPADLATVGCRRRRARARRRLSRVAPNRFVFSPSPILLHLCELSINAVVQMGVTTVEFGQWRTARTMSWPPGSGCDEAWCAQSAPRRPVHAARPHAGPPRQPRPNSHAGTCSPAEASTKPPRDADPVPARGDAHSLSHLRIFRASLLRRHTRRRRRRAGRRIPVGYEARTRE